MAASHRNFQWPGIRFVFLQAVLVSTLLASAASGKAPASASPSRKAAAAVPSSAGVSKAAAYGNEPCQAGRAQYTAGDVLKAIASLERCVEKESRNRDAWVTLATARLEAGRFAESADAFGRANSLRPGDAAMLSAYLDALEGAGRAVERVGVLRALAESKRAGDGDRPVLALLALVDSLGPARHPDDRLFALEKLAQRPGADLRHQEMLAAAYLERGHSDKAQAEYRALLSRKAENGEYWAGLAASLAKEDQAAALDCYRKAVFYSNQAGLRAAYEKEMAALQGSQPKPAVVAAAAARKPEPSASPRTASAEPAKPATAGGPSKAAAAKPFDLKAFQDSIYQVELAKRMGHTKKPDAGTGVSGTAPAPPAASADLAKAGKAEKERAERERAEREKTEKAEKEHLEKVAKEERERQEKLAKEAAKKAEEERKVQENLAREAEIKAKEDRAKRERFVRDSSAKAEKERLAKAEAERKANEARDRFVKDSTARAEKEKLAKLEAERKAKEARDRFVLDSVAKADRERLARLEADRKAQEARERFAKDSLAKADKERLARLEADRKDQEAREKAMKDSLARVEKERLVRLEAARKAKEAREKLVRDSVAKAEKERLAKLEAERRLQEARDRFVKDSLAKVEKERLARLEAERKAREERERFVKDSLAKVEKERLARQEAEKKAKEERERFVKDSLAKVEKERLARLEAERKAKDARDRFVKDSLAKVELERLAKLEAERKAREEQERKERLVREKQERHDRAISFYRAGQLDSAEALFRVVLEETPSPDALYYGGRLHLDKGRPEKALELLRKAPTDKPDLDALMGRAYLKAGKKKEALLALERHFAKSPDPAVLEEICSLRKAAKDGAWAACLEKLSGMRPMVGKYHEELAAHFGSQGDKPKSLERWAKLLALESAHGEANYHLGMDWGGQGVHDRAVPLLEKAVAAFPERKEAWKLLARGQAATGRKAAAWDTYQKAVALLPQDLEVARGRLALARDLGREDELPGAYQSVLKLSPQDPEANLGFARLRFAAKDYAAAEKHFRLGIPESKDAVAWGQYGRTLLETRKLEEAGPALQKALDLGETSISLRYDLARLQLDKGDADKAEALVKAISAKAPSDPEPYYWLAKVAEKRKQAAIQEEFLRKANLLKPDEVRFAEAVARLYLDRDEFKQAVSTLSPLEARLTSEGKMILADCLAATGEGRRALDIHSALFQKEPSAALLSRRIDALVRMGRAAEAVDAARGTAFADKAEVQFSLAKAHLSLAESHVIKGDLDLAASLLKKALDADDHRPEYHYHLGMAYYRKEKHGKAMGAFNDALKYRVDYPEAVYWKGVCLVETGGHLEARNYFGELSQHADARWKAKGLMGLARVFEAEGKWEAVEHHLMRSIGVAPNVEAMAYLSRVHHQLGRFPEAEEWAKKALALDPAYEPGTLALADALAARKKIPEALGLAQAALRVKPLSCDLLVQTAKLNLEAGRLDSTFTASGKAMEVCPAEPLPHYYAGMASRVANKPEDAKRHFKSFRKLGGDRKMLPE